MKAPAGALALCCALAAPPAGAWSYDGHRVVAAIAGQLIAGSNAQRQVAALLLPGESLEQLAIWPDCVKSRHCGAPTAEMDDYTRANPRHAEYHYANIPFQHAHYRDGAVGSGGNDIVQILKQAIGVLQGAGAANPHRFTPRQALILVAHLSGDLHQPLHVGVPYVRDGAFAAPDSRRQIDGIHLFDTRGGNDLLVDATRSFHAYWDGTTVDYALRRAGARTPRQFARGAIAGRPAVAANTGPASGWPYQWADDALQAAQLAHAGLAPGPANWQSGRNGEARQVWALALPADYAVSSSALARAQLIKGGYHLAALLRAIWP